MWVDIDEVFLLCQPQLKGGHCLLSLCLKLQSSLCKSCRSHYAKAAVNSGTYTSGTYTSGTYTTNVIMLSLCLKLQSSLCKSCRSHYAKAAVNSGTYTSGTYTSGTYTTFSLQGE